MTNDEASLRTVVVAGVGMTAFCKFLDRSIKSLVAESVQAAIKDAGIADSDKGMVARDLRRRLFRSAHNNRNGVSP